MQASIIYGGVKYNQIRHALYCKACRITIESNHPHDFKMCACGSIGIDGGIFDGNRILGQMNKMEPRSMYNYTVDNKVVWLPQEIIEELFYLKATVNGLVY